MYSPLAQRLKYLFPVMPIVLGIGMMASSSGAATLQFNLDREFSGAFPPEGPTPWLTSTFSDDIGGGDVRLTIDTPGLTGSEVVTGFYFNVNPAIDPNDLSFTLVANPTEMALGDIEVGTDAFRADGNGKYDVLLNFPPSGSADMFAAGEAVVIDISWAGDDLEAADFWYNSKKGGGNGTFITAAHVQGIGLDGAYSGWIGAETLIPEPSVIVSLLGAGLFLAGRRNRAR